MFRFMFRQLAAILLVIMERGAAEQKRINMFYLVTPSLQLGPKKLD